MKFFFTKVDFTIIILLSFINVSSQETTLLLKNGHVIDPKNNIDAVMDIAISFDKIIKVGTNIPASNAIRVIDLTGKYVTPGLIDMHVHVFAGNNLDDYIANAPTSVMPDGFTFRSGVTTVVDAGSSGWRNFPQFKAQTIDKAQTRVLALLNIVGHGMKSRFHEQDITDMDPVMTSLMVTKQYPDYLVGIKSAHYWGDFTQVDKAVEAGKLANVPVMIDFGEHTPTNSIEALFMQHLRPGDIFTHTYSYGPKVRETVVDEMGKVKPFVFKAQQRGIIFDVGHGGGAFSWIQAIPAIQQGFYPNVISTDLHTQSMNGGMKDLTNVLSKFMAMGMSLKEVIARCTWAPAQVIHREKLGHLSVGSEADIAVFSIREGKFGFLDIRNTKLEATKKLETELTIRSGKVVWDLNGISAPTWNEK
jgi:dihydroorotase